MPVLGRRHARQRGLVIDRGGHGRIRRQPLERGQLAVREDPEEVDDRGPVLGVGLHHRGGGALFGHGEARVVGPSRYSWANITSVMIE
jgi:hypothetical protein